MEKGIKGQGEIIVNESNTAQALGSGSIAVLSTPSMIALMEKLPDSVWHLSSKKDRAQWGQS